MAFTFTTLKTAIQDYVESNESTFVTDLPTIITQAEERILKSVQLPDFRKNATGTTTQSNQYLEVPSDFLATYSLSIDNSGYEFLIRKDVNFIREAYPVASTTGVPKHYALFNEQVFILGPTPNANALLYGCLLEAYTFLKGDPDLMQLYATRYNEALEDLKALGEGYNTTDSYRAGAVRANR